MKKTVTLIAAGLLLCCLNAMAQVSFLQANDLGNNNNSGSLTASWTAPTGTTSMAVCFEGDTIGGHDDITGVTYNGTSLTQVGKFTGPNGSHNNNRFVYLYKLNSPSTGAAHNIVISSTNNHYLLGLAAAYGGSSDIAGTVYVDGPQATSPWTTNAYTSYGGSMELICDGASGSGNVAASTNSVLEVQAAQFHTPSILDTGGPLDPPDSISMTASFNTNGNDVRIMAEVIPATTQFDVLQSTPFTSTNNWTFNASDSGMNSCDYEASVWDSTTSPYTNITSNATFTCDASYNVKAAFAGNQTGTMNIIPNPRKCATSLAPCSGTPPGTTHGLIGPLKDPVMEDNTSTGTSGEFSATATWTHAISSSCASPYLIVAITGNSAPSTQTITTATYNSVAMTSLTTVNSRGSGTNANPILWVYGIAPASTGSHSITVTTSAARFAAAAVSYCNVGLVDAGETSPHNEMFGPFNTSPQDVTVYPLVAGTMSMLISQTQQTSADTTTNTNLRVSNVGTGTGLRVYDTKTFVSTANNFKLGVTDSQPSFEDIYFQIIHLRPSIPVFWKPIHKIFPLGTTWTFNATDSGMQNCDYQASAWDTTTSPFTDLTSLATFTCDGSNNITATFSANQVGQMNVVPNATQ